MTDSNHRPGTLAEAIRRVESGQEPLGVALAEFLDTFYLDDSSESRRQRLAEPPPFTGDACLDAYIGAVGEHLARRWKLGDPPAWTEAPDRFLRRPWFPGGGEATKPILLVESPLAFRRRFIFTEAEPLRRARMPRDRRWQEYETLRTGIAASETP